MLQSHIQKREHYSPPIPSHYFTHLTHSLPHSRTHTHSPTFPNTLTHPFPPTHALSDVVARASNIYYYWVNYAPISRGTSATGYAILLGILLAIGEEPSGELVLVGVRKMRLFVMGTVVIGSVVFVCVVAHLKCTAVMT